MPMCAVPLAVVHCGEASRRVTRLFAAALLLCHLAGQEEVPRHAGAHVLRSGSLLVEVMDPTAPERYNTGVRFTPLAAVLRASFAGHEYFFNPLEHDRSDDHAGLASEFDLCNPGCPAGDLLPGYAEAGVGGGFLKIGVGVLEKSAKPYDLRSHPRLLQAASTAVQWFGDAADFSQSCPGVAGFAYELHAHVALGQGRIDIVWSLRNSGSRQFTTTHYTHNFFRFDSHDVGPDYALTFPYPISVSGAAPEQVVDPQGIRFIAPIPHHVNLLVPYPPDYTSANTCRLSHLGGMSIAVSTSVPGIRTAIHARPAYCSPEQFVSIALPPGGEETWTRSWVFSLVPSSR